MIQTSIPGFETENFELKHLILDFNGTMAIDGKLIAGVKERLITLAQQIEIFVLTGNSYGTAEEELKDLPIRVISLSERNQRADKEKFVTTLEKDNIISIGNGRNDKQMFLHSAISIIVLEQEGTSTDSLTVANIVCRNIFDALDLLLYPKRMKSTLRS